LKVSYPIVFTILLFLSSLQAKAADNHDVRFTPKLQKAYFEIQKLRIEPARALINEERKADPDNAFITYLDNYADLHYLLISEDKNAFKEWSKREDSRLIDLTKLSNSSPYKRFFQAEIRMHWAFIKMKFGNEVSASWEVIKAYHLLQDNLKKFPAFKPTLKTLGLLHVLIGSVPDNYTWVAKVLGLKGNIQQGIGEIQLVAREEPFFKQEAQLIDLLLHAYTLQLSEPQKALVQQLPKNQPDNLLLHFFATTILMKEGRSEDALYYLNYAPTGEDYLPFPFLDYLRGEIALQKGKYDIAFFFYSKFQQKYKGVNFIKDSNLKLFMSRWLADRDTDAAPYIKLAGNTGSTIVEGDKFAQRLSEEYAEGKITADQKILYKARYSTDGGYLTEAWDFIDRATEKSFTASSDKAELNYRKGRILQKMNQTERAMPYYDRAILLSQNTSFTFGPSAALQMGYMARDKKQNTQAISYFKKAMSYKKHEYKNSIDNKARAALTELGA
jgi:tetratricopeptide (TPR) repeat protein